MAKQNLRMRILKKCPDDLHHMPLFRCKRKNIPVSALLPAAAMAT
jgi:hypothetical protein